MPYDRGQQGLLYQTYFCCKLCIDFSMTGRGQQGLLSQLLTTQLVYCSL